MPTIRFDSLDQVPEGLQDIAKSVEGEDSAVTVDVVAKGKLDEFRDNNIELSKERDQMIAKMEQMESLIGDDPEAFKAELDELRQMKERVEAGELKESRALEEAVGKRTEEMRKSFEERQQTVTKELAAWKQKYEALQDSYKKEKVKNELRAAAVDHKEDPNPVGLHPQAVDDVIQRGLKVFSVGDDGKITASDGEATIYGADGVTPMTPREWMHKLREEAPYFFEKTSGGEGGGDQPKKVVGNMTREQIAELSASERLELANNGGQQRQ